MFKENICRTILIIAPVVISGFAFIWVVIKYKDDESNQKQGEIDG